jgi:hypothetical protein
MSDSEDTTSDSGSSPGSSRAGDGPEVVGDRPEATPTDASAAPDKTSAPTTQTKTAPSDPDGDAATEIPTLSDAYGLHVLSTKPDEFPDRVAFE